MSKNEQAFKNIMHVFFSLNNIFYLLAIIYLRGLIGWECRKPVRVGKKRLKSLGEPLLAAPFLIL